MPELFNLSSWLLDRHIEAGRGGRVAVRAGELSLTYTELLAEVSAAAAALRTLGVRPEERVVLVLRDTVAFAAAFLGAVRIGSIPVPANPLLPARDLAAITRLARARILLTHDVEQGADIAAGAPEIGRVLCAPLDPQQVLSAGASSWEPLLHRGADTPAYPTWEDSPAFWLCTSGTTGEPKLVMHRHADARVTAETYARHVLDLREDDRCYSAAPLFHAYGLGNALTFPLSVGASAIIDPARPPRPQLVEQIVRRERPTLFFCIPTVYAALLAADLPQETFQSVRLAVSAAEPLPAEVWRRFRERFGVEILDGIGSTEALHIFISNVPGAVRAGTSGLPVPAYEARLVDSAGCPVDCSVGEDCVGFLQVKGESLASGYWCETQRSRMTFHGEWMSTGDLYSRSPDGYYTYLGRADDMLRVAGEWVSPAEVEGVLAEHPGVLEAAVVGERDAAGAQRPVAYVVLARGQEAALAEVIEFCRPRLAGFKRPSRVILVDELPKTTTGKIQRFRLRAYSHEQTSG
ncbi:MAG: benzoate-CoA ligase family protein [Actinomycetia bacterium]|nr:benzoate-CoA ligase family protein [Actinomycetes bacterium]